MPTPEQRLRDLYGVAFPDSFFAFRDFLTKLPPGLLDEACSMRPCYPFDAADGKPATGYPDHPRWEDRYYHDLPEFVTLFRGNVDGSHWGYFFDAPGEREPTVAQYWHSDSFEHAQDGPDIFSAVRYHIERIEMERLEWLNAGRHASDHDLMRAEQLAFVREQLGAYWGRDRPETGEEYTIEYADESRDEVTADTWDRMGIIVPDGLYRPLSVDLAARNSRLGSLQPAEIDRLTAEALELLRAGYPGAALKLGRDLWVLSQTNSQCFVLLDAAYEALGREPLRAAMREARAFQAHCDRRLT